MPTEVWTWQESVSDYTTVCRLIKHLILQRIQSTCVLSEHQRTLVRFTKGNTYTHQYTTQYIYNSTQTVTFWHVSDCSSLLLYAHQQSYICHVRPYKPTDNILISEQSHTGIFKSTTCRIYGFNIPGIYSNPVHTLNVQSVMLFMWVTIVIIC